MDKATLQKLYQGPQSRGQAHTLGHTIVHVMYLSNMDFLKFIYEWFACHEAECVMHLPQQCSRGGLTFTKTIFCWSPSCLKRLHVKTSYHTFFSFAPSLTYI